MLPPSNTATSNELPLGLPGGRTVTQQMLDTPRKSGTPRSMRDLTQHRSEIIVQMRDEMVCCPEWDATGFGHYLPFEVSTADMEAATSALKASNLVRSDGPRLWFTSYPVSPSKIGTVDEKKRYEPLVDIANVLQELTLSDGREASCRFLQKPDNFNEGETCGANLKVDALLKLKRSTMPPSSLQSSAIPVADLAVPSEYKTAGKDARENRKQLLGVATFCMNDDPRRTHIYGITIEDDTMAVWYFSRSHSAKSPDFKFTEDCRAYIRVMLSLMFATEKELGYDPTIQRRLDPATNKICFVYDVNGQYYKTQKAIFDHRSLCITGRATRVWEVIEVASPDKLQPLQGSHTVVLKDVWLDAESMTEGKIQQEIFADLKKIADALQAGVEPEGFEGMDEQSKERLRECLLAQRWDRYFLTAIHEWQGMTSKEVAKAAVPDSTLVGAPPVTVKLLSFPHADPSRVSLSQPGDLLLHKEKPANRRHCPKRQSRLVFKQVCVALHDVSKLGDVLTALSSCVFALQLMFLAGWVHRDISSGNLYLFEDDEGEAQGILADLEYAKRFCPSGGKSGSDPKAGTAFFMAVEIQTQVHLYIPRVSLDLEKRWSALLAGDTGQSDSPFVVHNFQHDMESIFWVLLWTILVRFPCDLDSSKERSEFAGILSEIFQDTSICNPRRKQIFSQAGTLRNLLARYLPSQLESFKFPVDALRIVLVDGYMNREYEFDNMSSYSCLYGYLWKTLSLCQESIQEKSLPDLVPCRSSHLNSDTTRTEIAKLPLQVNKRGRDRPGAGSDDDEYRPVASKKTRGERSKEVLLF